MKKLLAALLAGAAALVLLGQTTESPIPNHSIPVGRGPGVVGWGNTGAACTSGTVLTCSTGGAVDPMWTTVGSGALTPIASNNLLGNATAATSTPMALPVPSCSGANQSLTWTTSSGFGCTTLPPPIASNNLLGNATSATAGPTGLPVPSCSAANQALTWTTNTGLGCATITGTGGTIATTPQILAATPNVYVDGQVFNTVQGLTVLVDASPIALDMSAFINASMALSNSRQLGNPTNTQAGREGCIYFTQPTTPVTLTFATNWKFSGGVYPSLTPTGGAVDVLCYQVRTSTFIFGAMTNDLR